MLILPDDDESFTTKMQNDLIVLFEESYEAEHITGGHLANRKICRRNKLFYAGKDEKVREEHNDASNANGK